MQGSTEQGFSYKSALSEIRRLSNKRFGPPREFSCSHVVAALFELESSGSMSREKLASSLELGGGSVKTLIRLLKDAGLINVKRTGNGLTEKGRAVTSAIHEVIIGAKPLETNYLKMGPYNVAVFINSKALGPIDPLTVRDLAVRMSATGMTTLEFSDDIVIPPDRVKLKEVSPEDYEKLLKMGARKGELILVCGAETPVKAKLAAIEVVMNLVKEKL
ncbi:MAG: DUF4443 domain-containing protein [Thermoprotei archaeon]